MKQHNADYFIEKLKLEPHPEGGYFKSTFRSDETITNQEQTLEQAWKRKLYTSIYFLLKSKDISHFHRLKSDEVWYYHAGSPLTVHMIKANGQYEEVKLGLNLDQGEVLQAVIPKNTIFGSSVMEKDTFSFVGCMVSPGFDFADFELFTQEDLLSKYPNYEDIIKKLAYKVIPD